MRLGAILDILETIAPRALAQDWDNAGLMVGDPDREVRTLLVALDPSLAAIRQARDMGVDLILTHHPLFFQPLRRLNLADVTARKAAMLLEGGVALVSMHTNLDAAEGGVADQLAARLGLADIQRRGMLRLGNVAPQPLEAWVGALGFSMARLCAADRPVARVAACPGSGLDLWREAQGCDTLVTGDVRYHGALEAVEAGLNVVDLGHYATEALVLEPLARRLRQVLPGIATHVHPGADIFTTLTR